MIFNSRGVHKELKYPYVHSRGVNNQFAKINGHGDERSSEIITPKTFKGFNNDITQTECQDKRCLNIFCHLVCAILLFTPHKCESLKTVYIS